MNNEIEHNSTDEIICPWCGYHHGDEWELSLDSDDLICDDCEKEFHYNRDVSISYTTERKQCGNNGCEYEVAEYSPYVFNGKNWTIWKCKTCSHQKTLTGEIAKDGEPYLIELGATNDTL